MSMWEATARDIAEWAWEEFKGNEEEAINFIWESVDGCENVI